MRSKNSTLMHEETFGPVCSFIGYQNEKEALSHINASPFGLAASVWSENMSKALRYAEDIDAGMVWVNMHTFLDPAVPFGGMKGSGIGREFGSALLMTIPNLNRSWSVINHPENDAGRSTIPKGGLSA